MSKKSIFDRMFPPRAMSKIDKQNLQQKNVSPTWNIFEGGKDATFFDLSDHEVITNGYNTNPYVYAVVDKLAGLMAMVPYKVCKITDAEKQAEYKSLSWEEKISYEGQRLKEHALEDVPDHDAQQLMDYPNKEQGGYEFRKAYFINKLVTGNMYIEALRGSDSRPPRELWNLPVLSVTLNPSNNFYDKVLEYFFSWGQTQKTIQPKNILHSKYYNPVGRMYGLSPLSAGRRAVQSVNDADKWNASLLQNGAKPEYVIVVAEGTPETERKKLKKRFMDEYGGPHKQTSEPIVTEEGFMKFESLGYTMKDMDWQNATLTNMRKVFDIYGVSGEVFNDPQNKTQSNKREAVRSLYTDRVLPEVESVKDEFKRWVLPMYSENNLTLVADTSGIDALNEELDKIVERNKGRWWMTPNRKLQSEGKDPVDNPLMDEVWVPSNRVPASSLQMTEITDEEAKEVYGFDKVKLNGHGKD